MWCNLNNLIILCCMWFTVIENSIPTLLSPKWETLNGNRDVDETRGVCDIIEAHRLVCETHFVVTRDGYILTVHRIINPKLIGSKPKLKAVILQHALLDSSMSWVFNSPAGGNEK